jgi:hypothetical protein
MSEDTRLWEETWTADGPLLVVPRAEGGRMRSYIDGTWRARLASAAPDLVRALLAVEWVGDAFDNVKCPSCGWFQEDGHDQRCAIDVALRKAGVR